MLALAAAIFAGCAWGITPSLYAQASREGGSARANFWKSLGALSVLLLMYLSSFQIPSQVAVIYIILNAALGTGIADYSFLRSIAIIGPSKATPIGFTYLIWSAILPSIVIGEPFSPLVLLGAALAFLGIWLISRGSGEWKIKGIILSLIASIGWTLSPIAARQALNYVSEITLATWNSMIVASLYLMLSLPSPKVRGQGKAALGGMIGVGVSLPLYFYAVRELGVAIASLTTALAPPVSQIVSVFSGNKLNKNEILGTLLITIGIILAISYRHS